MPSRQTLVNEIRKHSFSWWLESLTGWTAMAFAGKAAGKHGKDSGGKGHNTWHENMRALWDNYEGQVGQGWPRSSMWRSRCMLRSQGPTSRFGLTWIGAGKKTRPWQVRRIRRGVGCQILHQPAGYYLVGHRPSVFFRPFRDIVLARQAR